MALAVAAAVASAAIWRVPAGALILSLIVVGGALRPWREPVVRLHHRRRKGIQETLVALDRATENGPPPTVWQLADITRHWPARYGRPLIQLEHAGLIERDGDLLYPTEAGRAAARTLRRETEEPAGAKS